MFHTDASRSGDYAENQISAAAAAAYRSSNDAIVATLVMEDLDFIEKDLAFYEKVSILFMLYGQNTIDAKHALQRIIIGLNAPPNMPTTYLSEWARRTNPQWKLQLIEALATINAINVLRKLGLHVQEIHERFLPHRPDSSVYLHPILKCLYHMCEDMGPDETKRLVIAVQNNIETPMSKFPVENHQFLEVHMLRWLSEGYIVAGDCSQPARLRTVHCDMHAILGAFKAVDCSRLDRWKDSLQAAVTLLNCTTNNYIPGGKKKDKDKDMKSTRDTDGMDMVNQNFNVPHCVRLEDDEVYRIRKESAGLMLLINQRKFRPTGEKNGVKLDERLGTELDQSALINTFAAFGYKIVLRSDVSHLDILSEVDNVVESSQDYDSLVVCILSHGLKDHVYGSDSKPVRISDIVERMVSKTLLGKPKVLIVQACQGKEQQAAIVVEPTIATGKLAHDGPTRGSDPMRSDFCIAKSTITGFVSYRHEEKGTWFVQTLCKSVRQLSNRLHLLDILTKVCNEVSQLRGDNNECMVSMCETSLRKQFYFPPMN